MAKTMEKIELSHEHMTLVTQALNLLKAQADKVRNAALAQEMTDSAASAQVFIDKIEDLKTFFLFDSTKK